MGITVITVCTPEYGDMMHKYMLPKIECESRIHWINEPYAQYGTPAFLRRAWYKLHTMAEYARRYEGDEFLYLDVDQRFFKCPSTYFESHKGADLSFMDEWKGRPCTGCVYFKASEKMADLFEEAAEIAKTFIGGDQKALTRLIWNNDRIDWDILPQTLFVSGHKDYRVNIRPETIVYHANWRTTIREKIWALDECQEIYESSKFFEDKYGRWEPEDQEQA